MTPSSKSFQRLSAAAIIAMATVALPLTASAAAIDTTKVTASAYGEKITVSVPMDLLKSEEGTARLYAALERKAEKSCKTTIPLRVGQPISAKRCASALMDDFVTQISHDGLTSLHDKQG